ncbi:ribonuclease D [Arboricoccus pini]|uniref:Ribonuclease D n=1 Tax=Arboricoccus pini TaxID=1963835 RepID=A0A212QN84_9PROT|nr:ribonuclease D [Arboricoccus pini]SNB60840.1 ribonuclease D [Arboricoccus pini]
MTLIADNNSLIAFCERLKGERFITIDTEFMRDRTFWSKLCLIQIGGSKEAMAIDPLAPGLDLEPIIELMDDPAILKVFHAARQDLEIFWRISGRLPTPLYDTQIAAQVCGFGDEVAYETLVSKVAKGRLDKSSRLTDWSRRPLSEAQINYALGDVTHLRVIYERLARQISAAGRSEWVQAEIDQLYKPSLFEQNPEEAWRRIKVRTRDPRFLLMVQRLATWREQAARTRDLPRNRILRDDLLLELAASRPRTIEDLKSLDRITLDRESTHQVFGIVQDVLAAPGSALPTIEQPADPPRGLGPLVELLRVLLKLRCEEADVAQRLVASAGDLEAIAIDDQADVPALCGWRRGIFGEAALALKHGTIALAVRDGRPSIVELPR